MRSPLRRPTGRGPAAGPTTALGRRRFARRQWARRWLAWKYVVALVVVVALAAVGAWLVLASSVLAVEGVDVEGTSTLSAAQVREAADVPVGEPLARVDLDAIRARVEALAPVRSADVTREWPHRVLVTVAERQVVAVVEIGGRLRGMDASGVLFRDYRQAPPGVPRVVTPPDTRSDALQEAARVVGSLPDPIARLVDHVEVKTVDQISLVLRDGREVVWGSADESAQKAEVLAALLPHPARSYDVSVPGQPTTAGTAP